MVLDKNSPVYSVAFNKQTLIQDSPLTLTFDNGAFGENVKINKPVFSTKEETYELIVGKAKHIHSLSKEVIIPLEETVQPFRKINLVVRTFDDGIAFRYEFPKQKGWDSYIMYDEGTTFNLQGNPNVTTLFLPNYQSSHEGKYTVTDYADMDNKRLMDMPAYSLSRTMFIWRLPRRRFVITPVCTYGKKTGLFSGNYHLNWDKSVSR